MTEDTPPAFSLPAVLRKKVTAAFDGGRAQFGLIQPTDGDLLDAKHFERSIGHKNLCWLRRSPWRERN